MNKMTRKDIRITICYTYISEDGSTSIEKVMIPVELVEIGSKFFVGWTDDNTEAQDAEIMNTAKKNNIIVIHFRDNIGRRKCFEFQLEAAFAEFNSKDRCYESFYEAEKSIAVLVDKYSK